MTTRTTREDTCPACVSAGRRGQPAYLGFTSGWHCLAPECPNFDRRWADDEQARAFTAPTPTPAPEVDFSGLDYDSLPDTQPMWTKLLKEILDDLDSGTTTTTYDPALTGWLWYGDGI